MCVKNNDDVFMCHQVKNEKTKRIRVLVMPLRERILSLTTASIYDVSVL